MGCSRECSEERARARLGSDEASTLGSTQVTRVGKNVGPQDTHATLQYLYAIHLCPSVDREPGARA